MDAPDEDATPPLDADAEVPHRADSIPTARAFLSQLLRGWDVADQVIEDASLLTTELMTNAVQHGTGVVHLEITVRDGLLHVGVHDGAVELPVRRDITSSSLEGRGMWLVQGLARDWGSDSSGEEPGKTVWFELTTLRTPSG
jgi:anti-sigma regulatory factor (Ser/Thr protein kinase)